jgi:hypothetical protein
MRAERRSMSTVNATTTPQPSPKIVLPERMPPQRSEHKFTAADIEKDCPPRLREIGREITERLEEAREQTKSVDAHVIAVNNLIAEAKALCDSRGFNKFRELFCPQLRKSQAYVLLAIATGKTTLGEHRTQERERKQKTRANQKAVVVNSGTVPETPEPEGKAPAAPAADSKPKTNVAPEPTPELAKPRSGGTANDSVLRFTAYTDEILRRIGKNNVEHFAKIGQAPDVLARLGKFFTDLANLKKSHEVEPIPSTPPRNDASGYPGAWHEHV